MVVINNTKQEITVKSDSDQIIQKGETIKISEIVGSVVTFISPKGEAKIAFFNGEQRITNKGNIFISAVSSTILLISEK